MDVYCRLRFQLLDFSAGFSFNMTAVWQWKNFPATQKAKNMSKWSEKMDVHWVIIKLSRKEVANGIKLPVVAV